MEHVGPPTTPCMTSLWTTETLSAKVHRCVGTMLGRIGALFFTMSSCHVQVLVTVLHLMNCISHSSALSPDSLHIIKHDLRTGVSTAGKGTGRHGHQIVAAGARGQECWQTARSLILDKILAPGRCKLVAQIDLSGVEVRSWLKKQFD